MRSRLRLVSGIALLTLGLLSAISSAESASATTISPNTPTHERLIVLGGNQSEVAPFSVDRLAPGSSVSQRFRLHLTGHVLSGRPAVVLDHLRNLERGCNHPEVAAGDTTCGTGDGQGELGDQLLAGFSWAPATAAGCDNTAIASTTKAIRALSGVTLTAADPVQASAPDTCVTLTLTLPMSADNLVQSDAVAFDLRIGLMDSVHAGDAEAALTGGTAAAGGGPLTPGRTALRDGPQLNPVLPFTGLPLLPYALLTAGLFLVGFAALSAGRTRWRFIE